MTTQSKSYSFSENPEEIAHILERAGAYLTTHGWCQDREQHDERVNIIGALRAVTGCYKYHSRPPGLMEFRTFVDMPAHVYNDLPDMTLEKLLDTIKDCSKALRASKLTYEKKITIPESRLAKWLLQS